MAAPTAITSSSSSKRHSILPQISQAGPKPPIQFSSSMIIADSALLTGSHPITVRSESVIHPRARLESTAGRLSIGRRCIIHERSHIGVVPARGGSRSSSSSLAIPGGSGDPTTAVTLGDYVTVEVAALVEAGETVIGEGTIVGVGCKVGAGAVVGKHCTLTPHTTIQPSETIPDFTVIYSNGQRRTDKRGVADLRNKGQARQIEVLRRMIPSNPQRFQN